MKQEKRLAVLIDGDNINAKYITEMMEEITKYGNPTIKRIYGDWTKPYLGKWKNILLDHAIQPIQQYGYTTGKNATDSAMIIDAMDLLYSEKVDGFCLVSSDSDFTRLANRLREEGMLVIGLGEKKTPRPFIVACDRFIYLEILKKEAEQEENANDKKPDVEKITHKVIRFIGTAINDAADEDSWAFLGDVGNLLQKKQPNFDPRNYGFEKLTTLIASTNKFDIDRRNHKGKSTLIYVKNKSKR